jgi:hypothetical protein
MIRGQGTIKLYVVYNVLEVSINLFVNLDYEELLAYQPHFKIQPVYNYAIEFM